MNGAPRRDILGSYKFWGFSEGDMVSDLGDSDSYEVEIASEALCQRIVRRYVSAMEIGQSTVH